MVLQMISELQKFVFTFGVVIVGFLVIASELKLQLYEDKSLGFYAVFKYIFDGFNGNQDFSMYEYPQGKIFIGLFSYLFSVLLISFLVAMFINRYRLVYKNIDALRRMDIIKLKNSCSYDKIIGGVTLTFFPINLILLPFIIPVVVFKSERLNDFILKIQYVLMILAYCFIATIISVPLVPLLYLKCVFNAIYISLENKRQAYTGQNFLNLLLNVFLSLPIIILSLLVDLFALPNLLMKPEKEFEFKYPAALEHMDEF